jgi:hypothetical protein
VAGSAPQRTTAEAVRLLKERLADPDAPIFPWSPEVDCFAAPRDTDTLGVRYALCELQNEAAQAYKLDGLARMRIQFHLAAALLAVYVHTFDVPLDEAYAFIDEGLAGQILRHIRTSAHLKK